MKYRAVLKQIDGWWIGRLVDLPGVNAQERTREDCLESLRIGAEDMLSLPVDADAEAILTYVDVPEHCAA
ncbi:MAG: type II toxin-antitoxin system HicB family antitoxin [Lamprobacter sp.]|uniref:type II toxin-antitoxin system HicB family antitoxin n=1 Tax=Lamprobacter sp. TaxID=3100796 RepID=UPI002B2630F5|nr:type II toxin-antitoxin system HicB family antitoxin [Lamprobacter sp.]MEA3642464.1 type II toxin-antitoxin system HicB family antitoxin [Lamprobacter sp.]